VFGPGGTRENSPPIYRWEQSEQFRLVPSGRLKEKSVSSVPRRLRGSAATIVPSTEDAGLLSEIPPGLG